MPALFPDIQGILDPQTQGLMAAAGAGLRGYANQPRPVGLGQVLGGMLGAGIPAYQNAANQQLGRQMQMQQMTEAKRLHDAQITNYEATATENRAQAAQRAEAARRQALQDAYLATPEVQEKIKAGDIAGVISGLPHVTGGNILTLGEQFRKRDDAKQPVYEPNFPVGNDPKNPMVQPHYSEDKGMTWKPVPGSVPSPKFAKQVGTTVFNPAPVTAVTLQDPNDPNGTIVIDGRSGKVFGKGPKLTDVGKLENKRQFNMQGIGATIKEAEDLLSNKAKPPTGSGLGAAVDYAGSLVGYSPGGAVEAQRLRAIGGALVSKMPRMEGPQSDKDVALYKEMAGMVGDPTIPIDRRAAALEQVKGLWAKYERLNPDAFQDRRSGAIDEPPAGAVRRK